MHLNEIMKLSGDADSGHSGGQPDTKSHGQVPEPSASPITTAPVNAMFEHTTPSQLPMAFD